MSRKLNGSSLHQIWAIQIPFSADKHPRLGNVEPLPRCQGSILLPPHLKGVAQGCDRVSSPLWKQGWMPMAIYSSCCHSQQPFPCEIPRGKQAGRSHRSPQELESRQALPAKSSSDPRGLVPGLGEWQQADFAMEGVRISSHSGDGSCPPKGASYAATAALFISHLSTWKPALLPASCLEVLCLQS